LQGIKTISLKFAQSKVHEPKRYCLEGPQSKCMKKPLFEIPQSYMIPRESKKHKQL